MGTADISAEHQLLTPLKMCGFIVLHRYECQHTERKALQRATGAICICIFAKSPHAQYYCQSVGYEAFSSRRIHGPCSNCIKETINAGGRESSESCLGDLLSRNEVRESSSLRRLAILNHWFRRLDQEVEWNPTGAVNETLSYSLLHPDTTVEEAARWGRIIASLPKSAFQLEDQLSLACTWISHLRENFPDEDVGLHMYQLFVREGAFEKDTIYSLDGFRKQIEEIEEAGKRQAAGKGARAFTTF